MYIVHIRLRYIFCLEAAYFAIARMARTFLPKKWCGDAKVKHVAHGAEMAGI